MLYRVSIKYLVPARVLGAPRSDVNGVLGGTAGARVAVVAGAVTTAGAAGGSGVETISLEGAGRHEDSHNGEQSNEEQVHI